jgi:hypothetical protein
MALDRQQVLAKKVVNPLMDALLERDPEKRKFKIQALPMMMRAAERDVADQQGQDAADQELVDRKRQDALAKTGPQFPGPQQVGPIDPERPEPQMGRLGADAQQANLNQLLDLGGRQAASGILGQGDPRLQGQGDPSPALGAFTGSPRLEPQLNAQNLTPGQTISGTTLDPNAPIQLGINLGPISLSGAGIKIPFLKAVSRSQFTVPTTEEMVSRVTMMSSSRSPEIQALAQQELAKLGEMLTPESFQTIAGMSKAATAEIVQNRAIADAGRTNELRKQILEQNSEIFNDPRFGDRFQVAAAELNNGNPQAMDSLLNRVGLGPVRVAANERARAFTENIKDSRDAADAFGLTYGNDVTSSGGLIASIPLDTGIVEFTNTAGQSPAEIQAQVRREYTDFTNKFLIKAEEQTRLGFGTGDPTRPFVRIPVGEAFNLDALATSALQAGMPVALPVFALQPGQKSITKTSGPSDVARTDAAVMRTLDPHRIIERTAGIRAMYEEAPHLYQAAVDITSRLDKNYQGIPSKAMLNELKRLTDTDEGQAELRQMLVGHKDIPENQVNNVIRFMNDLSELSEDGFVVHNGNLMIDEWSDWELSPVSFMSRGGNMTFYEKMEANANALAGAFEQHELENPANPRPVMRRERQVTPTNYTQPSIPTDIEQRFEDQDPATITRTEARSILGLPPAAGTAQPQTRAGGAVSGELFQQPSPAATVPPPPPGPPDRRPSGIARGRPTPTAATGPTGNKFLDDLINAANAAAAERQQRAKETTGRIFGRGR